MKYEESMKIHKGAARHCNACTVNSLTKIARVEKDWRVQRQTVHISTLATAEAEMAKRTMKFDSEADKELRRGFEKREAEGLPISYKDLMAL